MTIPPVLFQPRSDGQDGLSSKASFHQLFCYLTDMFPGFLKGDMRVNVLCFDQPPQAGQATLCRLVLKFLEQVKGLALSYHRWLDRGPFLLVFHIVSYNQ